MRLLRLLTTCLFFCTLAVLTLSLGCSSTPDPTQSESVSSEGTDEQIFVGDSLDQSFDPHVILKRAEAFFEQEDYPEAIVEYQHFLDMHRSHMLAPYAQFRLAEGHLKRGRSIDRDTEPIRQALAEFQKLLKLFPGSKYEEDATTHIQECKQWIADTHLFIGEFYYKRESYLAAAHRFELVLKEYPEFSTAPEAMFQLAMSYKQMGADEWAREQLIRLAQQHPNHTRQSEAKKLLAQLNEVLPPTQLARSSQQSTLEQVTPVDPRTSSQAGIVSPSQPTISSFTAQRTIGSIPSRLSQPLAPQQSSTPGSFSSFRATTPKECRLDAWC